MPDFDELIVHVPRQGTAETQAIMVVEHVIENLLPVSGVTGHQRDNAMWARERLADWVMSKYGALK